MVYRFNIFIHFNFNCSTKYNKWNTLCVYKYLSINSLYNFDIKKLYHTFLLCYSTLTSYTIPHIQYISKTINYYAYGCYHTRHFKYICNVVINSVFLFCVLLIFVYQFSIIRRYKFLFGKIFSITLQKGIGV